MPSGRLEVKMANLGDVVKEVWVQPLELPEPVREKQPEPREPVPEQEPVKVPRREKEPV